MRKVPGSGGVALAVHDQGGAGRPTLLCHATGFHGAVWEPLSRSLGDDLQRWAPDLRGHGASPVAPGASLRWSTMAEDVLAVIDGLGLPAGELLGAGHSMGAAVLLLAEQARPGTFAGLWLYEPITPPAPSPAGRRLAEGARRRRPSFPSHAHALAHFATKPPLHVLRAEVLHAYVRDGFLPGPDGEVHLACRPEDEGQVFLEGGGQDAYAHLAEVRCPAVVACGGDPVSPAAFAPTVADALPAGRLERHEHLGHFGPLQAPEELAVSVRAFADELPDGSRTVVTPRA